MKKGESRNLALAFDKMRFRKFLVGIKDYDLFARTQ